MKDHLIAPAATLAAALVSHRLTSMPEFELSDEDLAAMFTRAYYAIDNARDTIITEETQARVTANAQRAAQFATAIAA